MPSILVVSGHNEGDYYPLGARTMVVGRDEGCPIQIIDELVSRKHMQIRRGDGAQYHALDMQSANGVCINGRQISDALLSDGDLIEIGNSKLVFSSMDFPDRESALAHYKKRGERGKSTLIQ